MPKASRRFADALARYQCFEVFGDAYGREWVTSAFREHGISYVSPTRDGSEAKLSKSELFLEMLPTVNSRQCVLLHNDRLERQLCLLERSVMGASGRERVDHPRGSHDDLANTAAGALVMARQRGVIPALRYLPPYADDGGHTPFDAIENKRPGYWTGPGWDTSLDRP
jgi:hypothetical protein